MSRDYTEITDEQLRAINKRAIEQPSYEQLREQNRVLREALLKVRPELYCMDKQLIASGYERGVSVVDAMKALEAALTATSQEGQHEAAN